MNSSQIKVLIEEKCKDQNEKEVWTMSSKIMEALPEEFNMEVFLSSIVLVLSFVFSQTCKIGDLEKTRELMDRIKSGVLNTLSDKDWE